MLSKQNRWCSSKLSKISIQPYILLKRIEQPIVIHHPNITITEDDRRKVERSPIRQMMKMPFPDYCELSPFALAPTVYE